MIKYGTRVLTEFNPTTGLTRLVLQHARPVRPAQHPLPVRGAGMHGTEVPERFINRDYAARGGGSTLHGPDLTAPPPPARPSLKGPPPELLKQWRKELGWTQRSLADAAGLQRGYVASLELPTKSKNARGASHVRIRLAELMGKAPADWGEG